jgi:hypothetical protein
MNCIYENKLLSIEEDDGKGVIVEGGRHIPYDAPGLIIDPTDDEVAACDE